MRSINTSIVGLLPVGSILFIGALLLGAGTLKDLSLALFIGIIVGTLGTLFVAAPLYALLRLGEKRVVDHNELVEKYRSGALKDEPVAARVVTAPAQNIEINRVSL